MENNILQLARKNIRELSAYSSARKEYAGKDGIFLDANENPFGDYNRYPDPLQTKLKKRLSEIKNVDANTIFIGNGSDEVIDLAFRIFCEPATDKALTFTPTYGMYEVSAGINNVELIKIPLDQNFQIDPATLNAPLKDPALKLILICSPNNPSGNLLDPKTIDYILARFSGIVLIDEAYIDFSGQNSFLTRLKDYPKLIVSQTLSKAFGLAGLRLGLAYMNENLLSLYNKVKPPYNISSASQEAALKALNNYEQIIKQQELLRSEKNKMLDALHQCTCITKIYPSDANFFLVEVRDANFIYDQLLRKNIIIRNRNSIIKNCVRITIGTPEENQKLITTLKNIGDA